MHSISAVIAGLITEMSSGDQGCDDNSNKEIIFGKVGLALFDFLFSFIYFILLCSLKNELHTVTNSCSYTFHGQNN